MNSFRSFYQLKGLLSGLFLNLLLLTTLYAQEVPLITGIEPPGSVLFTGNSLTFYNNAIYTHLRKFLVAEDPSNRQKVFLKSMTISGAKLSDHRGGLSQMLASREWDVVVLQGHSREPIDPMLSADFESTAHVFSQAIRSRGAEPVLFLTWAYSDQPETTHQLANAYRRLGKQLGVVVVPVGLAFALAADEIPAVVLHDQDHIHPSLEGTYLAAAVFYAELYGESPVELNYSAGLDESLARQLRQSAWQTVLKYYPIRVDD